MGNEKCQEDDWDPEVAEAVVFEDFWEAEVVSHSVTPDLRSEVAGDGHGCTREDEAFGWAVDRSKV